MFVARSRLGRTRGHNLAPVSISASSLDYRRVSAHAIGGDRGLIRVAAVVKRPACVYMANSGGYIRTTFPLRTASCSGDASLRYAYVKSAYPDRVQGARIRTFIKHYPRSLRQLTGVRCPSFLLQLVNTPLRIFPYRRSLFSTPDRQSAGGHSLPSPPLPHHRGPASAARGCQSFRSPVIPFASSAARRRLESRGGGERSGVWCLL